MAEPDTFGQRLRAKLSRLTLATKKSRKLLRKEPSTSSITPSSTTSTTRGSSPSSDENTTPRQPLSRQPSDVSWRSNLLRGGYNSKENKEFGSSRSLFHYTGHSTSATPTRGWSEDEDEDGDQRSRQSSAGHTPYVSTPGITPKASAASNLSANGAVVQPVSTLKKRSVDMLALSRTTSLCNKCKGETDTESAKSSLVEDVRPATIVSPVAEETQSAVLLATPTKEIPPAPAVSEAPPALEPTKESTLASTALAVALWPIPPPTKKNKKKASAPRSPPRVTFTPETPEPPPTPPIKPKSLAKSSTEAPNPPQPSNKAKTFFTKLFKRKQQPSPPSLPTSWTTTAHRGGGHGRKPKGVVQVTKDITDRGYGGLYRPVGMAKRSQMDALNPYLIAEKVKRQDEGGECPDCVAEREMKRHNAARSDVSDTMLSVDEKPVAKMSDAVAQLASPMASELHVGPTILLDASKATLTPLSPVARAPRPEVVRKKPGIAPTTSPTDFKSPMTAIMPDLISYIDHMATKMRVDIGRHKPATASTAEKRRHESQSLLQSEDAAPLRSPWTDEHDIIERDYWQLKREACLDSLTQSPVGKEELQSVYTNVSKSPPMLLGSQPASLDLPSAILRSNDLSSSPIPTPSFNLPVSRTPMMRTPINGTPSTYYTAPTSLHPTPPIALRPQKRVRVVEAWPSKEPPKRGQALSPLSPANVREREQFARQNMRLDREQAVIDAAEMERVLRRNVRAKGGLAGPSTWKK
nr:hypothetical protein B0A51_18506 [Rachicladosporium sp. CCFEE 5018]